MDHQKEEKENDEEVKSACLIKFEASNPRQFSTLPAAVDLKRPPSNWLNGQIKLTPSLSTVYKFSSFRMAFDFWRELGDVDVISDSENIKNLLKIPYSDKNVLSYFVHRIGNTLLIDDFDLHKYLLWKTEEDWRWLRSFIYENVLSRLNETDRKPIPIQHKTREFLEQKNLLSKFLYYSIEDSKRPEEKKYVPMPLNQPLLPQPKREDVSDNQNHEYSRNVLWTFEDIRMLIGSDMPIFGNQSRPCISLKLRDMKKPINVLTGIDYWLDNLMCNVPEIFLCFHQDGIVQKYELLKTEDLPSLENSKFSPKVIRNVAQNILSFLKANATKSGHTYWLFKAKNDDVVKLYDLTTLQLLATTKDDENNESSEKERENDQNPFTIPVAMLLYTVARNMKYSNEKLTAKQAGNIKQLLDNCLKLLPKDKYPQIVTSSHYILSDIQIHAGMDPANPSTPFNEDEDDSDENLEEMYEEQLSDDELDIKDNGECYSAIQSIRDAMNDKISTNKSKLSSKPAPLTLGDLQERCELALENVISGLNCLQYFESESAIAREKQKEKEQIIHEEQNPKLANPDVAIPMGWSHKNGESSKKKKKSKKDEHHTEKETTQNSNEVQLDSKSLLMKGAPNVKTWNTHLKVLLFEKASLAYACLAEDSYNKQKFGQSLNFLQMSIMCQNLVSKYVAAMKTQKSCLFGRAGDCYFQISKNLNEAQKHQNDFIALENDVDREILKELEKEELVKNEFREPSANEEEMLEESCRCYEISLIGNKESKFELVRRLGNVYNELGVYLMQRSQVMYNARVEHENSENIKNEQNYQQIAKKSYDFLMKAVTLFQDAEDSINLIICNLNLGRFFRLSAHINIFQEDSTTKSLQIQKKMYQESFNSYHRALAILENRKSNPELWDMVTWELSTSTFNLAKQMQDYGVADKSTDELERDVVEMLMKALKLCDLETNNCRQVLYCFRAGLIHHRLGSFYHQSLRSITDETKKRTTLQLCRLNYEKSLNLLESLKEFKDYFQVQMERIALQELLAEDSSNVQQKIRNYQMALTYFIDTTKMLELLKDAKTIIDFEEITSLMELFEKRLQHILKTLTKLTMSGKKFDLKSDACKKMFACTLRTNQKLELQELVNHLLFVVGNVQNILKSGS
ncbi:CLUMA_CG015066, isoform A [Clunio marinus]|uniref:CLUMA_CG015066, isoform A n=1 Tax=Clunio marinus TaxID=568069 RepID=A0A1J1IPQ7_9DIPT|nr:CLUMA_CG015066, isoform A [Clunio marinus]